MKSKNCQIKLFRGKKTIASVPLASYVPAVKWAMESRTPLSGDCASLTTGYVCMQSFHTCRLYCSLCTRRAPVNTLQRILTQGRQNESPPVQWFDSFVHLSASSICCMTLYKFVLSLCQGATNVYKQQHLLDEFFDGRLAQSHRNLDKRTVVIFHCEFSSERAPKMYVLFTAIRICMNTLIYNHCILWSVV